MFICSIAGALILAAPAPKDTSKPDKPPAGKWEMERFEFEEKSERPAPRAWLTEQSFGFGYDAEAGDTDTSWKATFFQVDGERRADLIPNRDPKLGVQKAIWKVDGDRFIICVESIADRPRPTTFAAPKGSTKFLFVLRRVGD